MKVLSSLASAKRRHADCQVVKRKGTLYVICKSNPKFKARQGATKGTRLSNAGGLRVAFLVWSGPFLAFGSSSRGET